MSISANIGLLLAVSSGPFSKWRASKLLDHLDSLARNDPHVKLMHLKELTFARLSYSAANAVRTEAIYTSLPQLSPKNIARLLTCIANCHGNTSGLPDISCQATADK